jgi:hypothetical protein
MSDEELEPEIHIFNWSRSAKLGLLVKAMAEAHAKFEPLKKEAFNPFFKSRYADLASGIDASAKALAASELVVFQIPIANSESAGCTTLLTHSSDQWISFVLTFKIGKFDPQGVASIITYARRYSREAILDMAGEVDLDGEPQAAKTSERKSAPTEETKESAVVPKALRTLDAKELDERLTQIAICKSKEEFREIWRRIDSTTMKKAVAIGDKAAAEQLMKAFDKKSQELDAPENQSQEQGVPLEFFKN